MKHIHLSQIESTQNYLRQEVFNLFNDYKQILVSTEKQQNGIGRKNNRWVDSAGSVAFSFTLEPVEKLSLIPLWVSLNIQRFFAENYNINLQLKWPNDLYYKEKKCGGVICQKFDDVVIVGVGLNLFYDQIHLFDNLNEVGFLEIAPDVIGIEFKKTIPLKLYNYFLSAPFNSILIPNEFKNNCLFIDQVVSIADEQDFIEGKFVGIGEWGEALIATSNNDRSSSVTKVYNGSLRKKY